MPPVTQPEKQLRFRTKQSKHFLLIVILPIINTVVNIDPTNYSFSTDGLILCMFRLDLDKITKIISYFNSALSTSYRDGDFVLQV
jgi:hypothetical protein